MPLNPTGKRPEMTPVHGASKDLDIEAAKKSMSREYFEQQKNLLIPEEVQADCPVFTQLYNLFEEKLPCTGHFAGLVATILASMCTDSDRQANLSIGADASEGKTSVLEQFERVNFVNPLSTTTYADFMLSYCGYYLKSLGEKTPLGVKRIQKDPRLRNLLPAADDERFDKSGTKDLISNRIDIISGGELVFSNPDSIRKLQHFWNFILDEGRFSGGDMFSGHYEIGISGAQRVKHGLIIASTIQDFDRNFVFASQGGWTTRMILSVYNCTPCENEYISKSIVHQKFGERPYFASDVAFLLNSHLIPTVPAKVSIDEESATVLEQIVPSIMRMRGETTGKRASWDVTRLAKGFAWLNKMNRVTHNHLKVLSSLLLQCNRLPLSTNYKWNGENRSKISGWQNFGSRLDFQIALRNCILQNREQVRFQINQVFRKEDGAQFYSDNETDTHINHLVHTP